MRAPARTVPGPFLSPLDQARACHQRALTLARGIGNAWHEAA